MPSAAVDFRASCGLFVPIFVGFMLRRAAKKMAARIAIIKLSRRVDGVTFGLLLTYLFWGSLILRCGDVESNPGPPPSQNNKDKDNMRQTRFNSSGTSRTVSLEKTGSPRPSSYSAAVKELTLEDVMNTLTGKLEEVRLEVHQLREDYAGVMNEVKGLREEMTELKQENQELKKTNGDLKERLGDCERRVDDLEGRSKRNNLIFYGLPRRDSETPSDCEDMLQDFLADKLDMSDRVELDRVHRLNAKPDSPIIACCTFYRQKVKILKQKSKLKGTNVFIGEDFSKGVRDIRRRLAPHLKTARQEGKRATLVFNHLLMDGQKYSVDDSDQLVRLR